MNCAPITVTAGAKKRGVEKRKADARSNLKRASFPAMLVANIGNGCNGAPEGSVTGKHPQSLTSLPFHWHRINVRVNLD